MSARPPPARCTAWRTRPLLAGLPHCLVVPRGPSGPVRRSQLVPAPIVCVLTAHPAKFEQSCVKAGVPAPLHPSVERLKTKPLSFEWLRAPPKGRNKLEVWAAAIKAAVEQRAEERAARAKGARMPSAKKAKVPRSRL